MVTNPSDQLQAVHFIHPYIRNQNIRLNALKRLQCSSSILCFSHDLKPADNLLNQMLEARPDQSFIFNQKQLVQSHPSNA
ncbi:hypothetical protein D3C75_938840 [compost metagenome]